MAKGFIGAFGCQAYLGAVKMRKGYIGVTRVYSAGNIVTYHVDTGISYQEEVDEGESCLSPKTFTPSKSGWEFVGWRSDSVVNGSVLSSKVMDDGIVTLYAVFRKAVTVTYYDNSTTASSTSGYRYYNNGNVVNPSFTLTQSASSGWTARGWSTGTAGNSGITYNNGVAFTRDSNITLYGMYQKTITVTYYNNSTTATTTSGTRYYNSNGNVINPSFTLTQSAKSGWTARGWSTGTAGNSGITYNNSFAFTRDSNITLYGMYQQTITVTYYNNSTTAATTSGTRYYNSNGNTVNPSFTLTQASKSGWTARGWSTSTAGNGSIAYSNATAFTRDSNVTLYGMYYQTITLTYYNGSTTASSTSGTRYYNSGTGNAVNPTFTLTPATLSGWTFRGWATSSAATADIAYSRISGTAFAASATVYAAYSQTITLSYNGNGSTGGSTAAQTGTRYWNTGNVSNPSFTLSANGFAKSGYTFSKWALGSASGTQYAAGASVTLSASTTMYAVWTRVITPYTWVTNYIAASGQSLVINGSGQGLNRSLPTNTFFIEDLWDAVATPNFSVYTNKVDVSGLTKMSMCGMDDIALLYYGGLNGGKFTIKSDKGDIYTSSAQINGSLEVDITGADWIQILATASTHNRGSGGIMFRIREIKFS